MLNPQVFVEAVRNADWQSVEVQLHAGGYIRPNQVPTVDLVADLELVRSATLESVEAKVALQTSIDLLVSTAAERIKTTAYIAGRVLFNGPADPINENNPPELRQLLITAFEPELKRGDFQAIIQHLGTSLSENDVFTIPGLLTEIVSTDAADQNFVSSAQFASLFKDSAQAHADKPDWEAHDLYRDLVQRMQKNHHQPALNQLAIEVINGSSHNWLNCARAAINNDGQTPLLDFLLLRNPSPGEISHALGLAIERGAIDSATKLFNAGAKGEQWAVVFAARTGNETLVDLVLKKGLVQPGFADKDYSYAEVLAAGLEDAIIFGQIKIAKKLLDAGANPKGLLQDGRPLQLAQTANDVAMMELLQSCLALQPKAPSAVPSYGDFVAGGRASDRPDHRNDSSAGRSAGMGGGRR